jgi:hypothetical protein
LKNFNPFFMAGTAFVSTSSDGLAMASVALAAHDPPHHRWWYPHPGTRGVTPHPTLLQKAVRRVVLSAAIPKPVGCPTCPNGLPPMVFSSLLLLAADAAPKRLRPEAPAAAPVAMVRG